MPHPVFTILYVNHPQNSAGFYEELLQQPPLELSPTFGLFKINDGFILGLWSKHTMQPTTTATPGAIELALPKATVHEVDTIYKQWQSLQQKGLVFLSAPQQMEFGYNFIATDPDGHRIRVFCHTSSS